MIKTTQHDEAKESSFLCFMKSRDTEKSRELFCVLRSSRGVDILPG